MGCPGKRPGSFEFILSLLFLLWIRIFGNGTGLLVASSSLRSDTELEDELEADGTNSLVALSASLSRESDAEDELFSGLVDNPGTTRYEIICLADDSLPVFGQPWLLTADPLKGVSVVFAGLAWRWGCGRLHGYEQNEIMN